MCSSFRNINNKLIFRRFVSKFCSQENKTKSFFSTIPSLVLIFLLPLSQKVKAGYHFVYLVWLLVSNAWTPPLLSL